VENAQSVHSPASKPRFISAAGGANAPLSAEESAVSNMKLSLREMQEELSVGEEFVTRYNAGSRYTSYPTAPCGAMPTARAISKPDADRQKNAARFRCKCIFPFAKACACFARARHLPQG